MPWGMTYGALSDKDYADVNEAIKELENRLSRNRIDPFYEGEILPHFDTCDGVHSYLEYGWDGSKIWVTHCNAEEEYNQHFSFDRDGWDINIGAAFVKKGSLLRMKFGYRDYFLEVMAAKFVGRIPEDVPYE